MSRRLAAVLAAGALVALAIAATSSASSPSERWMPVDFLKTVRQRYPAFVRVTPLGFNSNGRLYWTARTSEVVIPHPRQYTDGTIQHVFIWQDGKTRDLGSLGQSDNNAWSVNARGQLAVTRSVGPFTMPAATHVDAAAEPRLPLAERTLHAARHAWRSDASARRAALTLIGPVDGQPTDTTGTGGGRVVGGTVTTQLRAHAFVWENGHTTVLPSPRLATTPKVWIDSTGTRILAVSQGIGGLRTRIILWTLRRG